METETLGKKCLKVVPQLRFEQYTGDFKNKNLKDLIKDLNSGISVNSEDYPIQNEIEAGILKTNCVSEGVFFENENKKIVQDEITRAKLNPTKGQIIISRMNTPELVGASGYIDKDYLNLFIPDRLWQTVVDLDKCDSRWLSYFLITNKVRNNLKAIATGTSGTMKNISKPNFLGIKVQIPTKDEQQKIASFLSAVDKKIHQLTRKKELLETYKKGVMQKLFSQEIRFKNEDGKDYPEWKPNRLKNICSFFSGGTPTSTNKKFYSGSIPFIGSGNIHDSNVTNFITEEAYNSSSAKRVEVGDILYALYGANSGEVAISKMAGAINQAILCIRTTFNTSYLYYLLNFNQEKIITKYLQGGQGNLSANIIKNLKYEFPVEEEQQKIADFLSAIDKKIEAVSKQIEKTQTFKKGLLQQMFV